MTAQEFVKSHYPNARIESQVEGMIKGLQTRYYLIRVNKGSMYFASGNSKSNAWVNAKKRILSLIKQNNEII